MPTFKEWGKEHMLPKNSQKELLGEWGKFRRDLDHGNHEKREFLEREMG